MRILITTDVFPPGGGGSAHSTAVLARALARRGHEVRVVVGRRNVRGEWRRDWEGVSIVEVGLGKSIPGRTQRESRLASYLRRWSPEGRFDVAHAQHWLSAKATVEAAVGIPVVVTVRDYWPVCVWSTKLSGTRRCPGCSYTRRVLCLVRRRPWMWPLAAFLPPVIGRELGRRLRTLEKASAVVAVSEHIRRLLPVKHSVVIPNFLDLNDTDRKIQAASTPEIPEHYLLFVGKIENNKAPDRLLPIVGAADVRVPLLIAGKGSLERRLREAADRSGAEVRFLGWVDPEKVPGLMARAAAVLFPSRWDEPLSRVLLEGLGAGAVLIVEPTGGSEEMVIHGESGLIGRSVEELGSALRRVLNEDGLAARLRRGARQRAEEHFSEEVVLPKLEALYERVGKGGM